MLNFDRQGLIPVTIQDDVTNEVLMLAFMNEEAYRLTRETGYTHFYSRSRQAIWRKGEQSGHAQEVRTIFVNCEENSLLIRVKQHGDAACHTGYRSCYYRRILPDGSYETIAERIFDREAVYGTGIERDVNAALEFSLRKLYNVYQYLRDRDLSEQSNTSRLLQESMEPASGTTGYLLSRLADELEELVEVQSGEHVHAGRQPDTILEASQVGYWLMLLAVSRNLSYDDFMPHVAMNDSFTQHHTIHVALSRRRDAIHRVRVDDAIPQEGRDESRPDDGGESSEPAGRDESRPDDEGELSIDQVGFIMSEQDCLSLLSSDERAEIVRGLQAGFEIIGRMCAEAEVSVLAPVEYDLEQMRWKGLVE
jgi:phosphoribosyl-AMP cyclohydrolase/phosphoribosyl-ATP pyrophosphohydrolase